MAVSGERIEPYEIHAGAVILASNGFGANKERVSAWVPEIAGVEYFGALGSTGEGIEWGLAAGGQLANAGAYQGYAAVAYPHGSLVSWTTIEMGAVIVDRTGHRLGDEIIGYSGFTKNVLDGEPPFFVIYDQRIKDVALKEDEYREYVEIGGAPTFSDISELAAAIDVDGQVLQDTIDRYNTAAAGQATDALGRTNFGLAPLQAPFVMSRVTPGLFHTQGGLAVDASARVLTQSGAPIHGLFAVGGVAAGVSGAQGGRGYSSGNGLLAAIGLGRIAGQAAMVQVESQG